MMEWVIYLFGSGLAFFIGLALLFAALVLFSFTEKHLLRALGNIVIFTGLLLVALSATPISPWWYGIAAIVTLLWWIAGNSSRPTFLNRRKVVRGLVATVWLVGIALELPYHWMPALGPLPSGDLFILGDSVAAGVDDRDIGTWPRVLAQSSDRPVQDLSKMGATVRSALKQAEKLPASGGIVLLEIGGNDLLGSTSSERYEKGLEELLRQVCAPDRLVIMFELPSFPFANAYGRSQRRLATEYGVFLIPKRVLVQVLTAGGATLDSVHLSKQGHQKMAQVVRDLLQM